MAKDRALAVTGSRGTEAPSDEASARLKGPADRRLLCAQAIRGWSPLPPTILDRNLSSAPDGESRHESSTY